MRGQGLHKSIVLSRSCECRTKPAARFVLSVSDLTVASPRGPRGSRLLSAHLPRAVRCAGRRTIAEPQSAVRDLTLFNIARNADAPRMIVECA
jgi:hypothetical protein